LESFNCARCRPARRKYTQTHKRTHTNARTRAHTHPPAYSSLFLASVSSRKSADWGGLVDARGAVQPRDDCRLRRVQAASAGGGVHASTGGDGGRGRGQNDCKVRFQGHRPRKGPGPKVIFPQVFHSSFGDFQCRRRPTVLSACRER
jgi:hypothetical protein